MRQNKIKKKKKNIYLQNRNPDTAIGSLSALAFLGRFGKILQWQWIPSTIVQIK